MIDGLPLLRILAPTHKNLIGQRVGVFGKPPLLLGIPVLLDMSLANQYVWLFFMGFDKVTGFDSFDRIHCVIAFAIEDQFPFLVLPLMSFQSRSDDLFEKLTVAPRLVQ